MSYGQIYCSTNWGDDSNKKTVNFDFSTCGGSGGFSNTKSVLFDGVSPAESISTSDIGYQFLESEGMVIMAWVKMDTSLDAGTYTQKCIVDYSSDIGSTSNGKGYAIYVRRTSTKFVVNWFYKRIGETRAACNIEIDLNQFDFSKPMLLVASLYPDNVGGVPSTHQDFRVWQQGINPNNYVEGGTKTRAQVGSTFPSAQDVCFGNTSNAGTVGSEFAGNIDEVVIYRGANGSIGEDYKQLSDEYFQGLNGSPQLDVSQLALSQYIRGWYRFGDNYQQVGSQFQFPNASGGSGQMAVGDIDFTASQIVSNII